MQGVYPTTPPNRSSSESSRNHSNSKLRPGLQQMIDMMATSNQALFRHSLHEILQDHDEVMEHLFHARSKTIYVKSLKQRLMLLDK